MLQLGSTSFVTDGVQVFHDHADGNVFWFLPGPVSMGTRPDGSPAFTLMVFKPAPGADTGGGGFLTFESMLTLDTSRRNRILSQCRSRAGDPARDVELSPVPFDGGTVECIALNVQGPGGTEAQPAPPGSFNAVERILGANVPALFGDNRAAFSLMLDQEGATIVRQALAKGGAPVGVIYKLQFTALRPSLHVKITADLKRVYQEFGASLNAQVYFVRGGIEAVLQDLQQQGVLKIEITAFTTDSAEQEKWAMQFFVDHLLKEWFEPTLGVADIPKAPTPDPLNPAGGTKPATGGTTVPGVPGTTTPKVPGAAVPGTPGAATPGAATPGAATPGTATPGTATPGAAKPAVPGQPAGGPPKPVVPGQPAAPGQPAGGPPKPVVPGQPAAPGQPATPGQPGQPAKPAGPASPAAAGGAGTVKVPVQPGQTPSLIDTAAVSFKLKFVRQEELRQLEFVYDRTDAVQRTYAPQGFFGDLGDALLDPSHLIEIDLDDPFFRTLSLEGESMVTDFAAIGLQSMNLHLEYGRDTDPGGPKSTDFVFTATSATTMAWSPPLNAHLDAEYRYRLEYHFDPSSGWHGADVQYTIEGTSTDRRIELTPYHHLGFLDVTVQPGDLDAQIVRATDVAVTYDDGNGWTRADTLRMEPGSGSQRWLVRTAQKAGASYRCEFRHTLVDGSVRIDVPEPQPRSANTVVVNDPFPDHLEIDLVPAWQGAVRSVLVDLEYDDAAGYRWSRRVEVDGATTATQHVRIGLVDPTIRSFTWRATFVGVDGVTTDRAATVATDTIVRLSPI
ncbi:MAG: hypothetical protein Q7V88_15435 [Actinomycetota bacterium]|nr:hypothetical protein [Actinomycetota bacterium]